MIFQKTWGFMTSFVQPDLRDLPPQMLSPIKKEINLTLRSEPSIFPYEKGVFCWESRLKHRPQSLSDGSERLFGVSAISLSAGSKTRQVSALTEPLMFCRLRTNLRYIINHNRQEDFAFTVRLTPNPSSYNA